MESFKILIVDDEIISSMYWTNILGKMKNVFVRSCSSGEKAIELARAENPDLIMMDIHLIGELDGIETAELISKFCNARIIFITGYIDSEILDKLNKFDSATYLIKPIMISDIIAVLDKWGIRIQEDMGKISQDI